MKYADLGSVLSRIGNVVEFSNAPLLDPNQRGIFGNTPLKVAIVWDDLEAVELLLKAGADVGAELEDGQTALHFAANFARPEILKLLLAYGASTAAVDNEGKTPLQIAEGRKDVSVVHVLTHATRRSDEAD